jgi:Polyketide cyclase / dehydrase and lipid transport
MKKYRVTHSEMTQAQPEDVWALWTATGNWPDWDEGLDTVTAAAGFEKGKSIMLKPKGAPAPLEVKLVDVKPGQSFTDETQLPFGVIRASHLIEKVAGRTRLTHTIEAEIAPEHAKSFEKGIWSGMQGGVAQSVRNLTKLAERRKKQRS